MQVVQSYHQGTERAKAVTYYTNINPENAQFSKSFFPEYHQNLIKTFELQWQETLLNTVTYAKASDLLFWRLLLVLLFHWKWIDNTVLCSESSTAYASNSQEIIYDSFVQVVTENIDANIPSSSNPCISHPSYTTRNVFIIRGNKYQNLLKGIIYLVSRTLQQNQRARNKSKHPTSFVTAHTLATTKVRCVW